MYDPKRLKATEQQGLIRMNATVIMLREAEECIGARIRTITRGWWRLKLAQSLVKRLCWDLFDDIPQEQQPSVERNVKSTVVRFGAVNRGEKCWDEFGTWVSWRQLGTLMDAITDHCAVCQDENRHCELRKVLDSLPNDVEKTTHVRNRCQYGQM